jgi:hypothetical protein
MSLLRVLSASYWEEWNGGVFHFMDESRTVILEVVIRERRIFWWLVRGGISSLDKDAPPLSYWLENQKWKFDWLTMAESGSLGKLEANSPEEQYFMNALLEDYCSQRMESWKKRENAFIIRELSMEEGEEFWFLKTGNDDLPFLHFRLKAEDRSVSLLMFRKSENYLTTKFTQLATLKATLASQLPYLSPTDFYFPTSSSWEEKERAEKVFVSLLFPSYPPENA